MLGMTKSSGVAVAAINVAMNHAHAYHSSISLWVLWQCRLDIAGMAGLVMVVSTARSSDSTEWR